MARSSKKNFTELHEVFQGNMFPGMLSLLSNDLGVSERSLTKLGLGYNPAKNVWVFPERDSDGEIVGLVYRTHDGFKFTEKGSKRGLTYSFNQDYEVGERRYSGGKHNWLRTTTLIPCPICGKHDWCMVSAEEPTDPKAVLCCRVEKGCKKVIESSAFTNYLHIMKDEGELGGKGRVVSDTELPILVVEGQTDVAAALDMGFEAIGRPSAVCNTTELEKIVIGKDVIIIGENDDTAGVPGMEKTFINLEGKCTTTIKLLPPDGSKDLRKWKERFNLTVSELLAYSEEHGEKGTPSHVLPDNTGLTVARAWVNRDRTEDGYPTVRSYKGRWVEFNKGRYELCEKEILRGEIYRFLDGKHFVKEGSQGKDIDPFKTSARLVSDVVDALYSFGPITKDPPLWLKRDRTGMPDPVDLIPFRNGILDVAEYLKGGIKLYDPTPNLFTFTSLPFDFDETMESELWINYLDGIFNGDTEKINLLQEWFGYNLVPDMTYEKLMMFVGRPRSGKGTVLHALASMLGDKQVCSTSFRQLCSGFGYQPLLGTLAALMGDAKVPRQADSAQALEKILQIVGGDPVGVDRKGIRALPQVHLSCRFTMAMNLLPYLPDHAQALEPRINLIQFDNSYIGKEDRTLKRRLKEEAPAILPWALEGLKRLRTTQEFTVPGTSKKAMDDLRAMTTPVWSFAQECCSTGKELEVEQDKAFAAWDAWCRSRSMRSGFREQFSQMLKAVCPDVVTDQKIVNNKPVPTYKGVELQPWVFSELLGKP